MIGNRELYFQIQLLLGHLLRLAYLKDLFKAHSFFLKYTNDIVDDTYSCIRLFDDDTSLYIIVDNPISDLAKIHAWAVRWLVSFYPAKSESKSPRYDSFTNIDTF